MAYLQKEEFAYDQEKGRRIWQKVLREYGKKYRLTFDDARTSQGGCRPSIIPTWRRSSRTWAAAKRPWTARP